MTTTAYDPRTLSNTEILFEPEESLVFASNWKYETREWVQWGQNNGQWRTFVRECTLALTQERMYFVQFSETFKSFFGSGGMKVSNHWSRHYRNFTNYRFDKVKTNKGVLQPYKFAFDGDSDVSNWILYTNPSDAEYQRSKELFIGRSPDAQQDAQRMLLSLKQLRDARVLSEAEYSTKKWDVLSR
jgi:hypothetical protein